MFSTGCKTRNLRNLPKDLPSGGDNSYPGFVELDDGTGLVSWYSSHEKDANGKTITAIRTARVLFSTGCKTDLKQQ